MIGLQPRQLAAALFLSLPLIAAAEIPESMSYQGFLTDRFGSPISDTLEIEFAIYTVPTGGVPLWTDIQEVVLFQGLFSAELGSDVNPFPADLFETPLFLGIKVGADTEMVPRRAITSVAFAFQAEDSNTLQGLTLSQLQADLAPGVRLKMGSESLGRVVRYETEGGDGGDTPSFGSAEVALLTDTGLLLQGRYDPRQSPTFGSGNTVYFTNPDCTGQAYIYPGNVDPLVTGQGIAFMAGTPLQSYYIPKGTEPELTITASFLLPDGSCADSGSDGQAWPIFPNDPDVTGLPDSIDGILVLE